MPRPKPTRNAQAPRKTFWTGTNVADAFGPVPRHNAPTPRRRSPTDIQRKANAKRTSPRVGFWHFRDHVIPEDKTEDNLHLSLDPRDPNYDADDFDDASADSESDDASADSTFVDCSSDTAFDDAHSSSFNLSEPTCFPASLPVETNMVHGCAKAPRAQ